MSKYATTAGIPTRGDTFAKLLHHMRESQDCAAMMAHLHNTEANDMDKVLAHGWLGIEELLKRLAHQVTQLAMRKMQ